MWRRGGSAGRGAVVVEATNAIDRCHGRAMGRAIVLDENDHHGPKS